MLAPLLAPPSCLRDKERAEGATAKSLGSQVLCRARYSAMRRCSPRPGSRAGSRARGERPPLFRGSLTQRFAARVGPPGSLPPRPQPRSGPRDGTARDPLVLPSRPRRCRAADRDLDSACARSTPRTRRYRCINRDVKSRMMSDEVDTSSSALSMALCVAGRVA